MLVNVARRKQATPFNQSTKENFIIVDDSNLTTELTTEDARKDGGPAFPQGMQVGHVAKMEGGLSVRDYFAAKAMQAFITGKGTISYKQTCLNAYELADAMLAAREKK